MLTVPEKDRPQSLSAALKQCPPDTFPSIFTLLKLFTILPLRSCSCERSASALRRLNSYLRCSQTEEQLSVLALALVHCNYDTQVDVDSVCKLYLEKRPRRISVLVCSLSTNCNFSMFFLNDNYCLAYCGSAVIMM